MALHLIKLCVGCDSIADLRQWQRGRLAEMRRKGEPARSDTLAAVAEAPYLDTPGRIETLYLAALTRRPRPDEIGRFVPYVDSGGSSSDRSQALADVFWALLNSPEFRFNH